MSANSASPEDRLVPTDEREAPRQIIAYISTIVVCLIAGASSWLNEKPGASLLWPMAVDVIIFATFGSLCRLVSAIRNTRFGRIGPSSVFLGLCVTSLLWTYLGVLPASVAFNSASASVARDALERSAYGCQIVIHRSVGLLHSPYEVCTEVIPRASRVEFTTPNLDRGYAYVSGTIGEGWFSDECSRHLIGHWWAFANDRQAPVTRCPFGYTFDGGG